MTDSNNYRSGNYGRRRYIDTQLKRLFDIVAHIDTCGVTLKGPTLDIASSSGVIFPAIKKFASNLLPYSIAELNPCITNTFKATDADVANFIEKKNLRGKLKEVIVLMEGSKFPDEVIIEGVKTPCYSFECEREPLAVADQSFNTVLFLDILEHLVVDPVFAILELNRVLRIGGHLIIATPNIGGTRNLYRIMAGVNPINDGQIKPGAIYQRHNREWLLDEIVELMSCCGFGEVCASTYPDQISSKETSVVEHMKKIGWPRRDIRYMGPRIFLVAKKIEHLNTESDIPRENRWPDWLYTAFDVHKKRPVVFPINVGPDYI